MKVPVGILTYKRAGYLDRTLSSFRELNAAGLDHFVFILLVQGGYDDRTEEVVLKHSAMLHDVIRTEENRGCAAGYNIVMSEALKLGFPYVMHLQDDWESKEPLVDHIADLIGFLGGREDVGYVRLRTNLEHFSHWNRISKKWIFYRRDDLFNKVWVGNAHFTLNPSITKARVIKQLVPIVHEYNSMAKYHQLGLLAGQLDSRCFFHIGHKRAYTKMGEKQVWQK